MTRREFWVTILAVVPFAWAWSEAFDLADLDGWLLFAAAAWWRWIGPHAEAARPTAPDGKGDAG